MGGFKNIKCSTGEIAKDYNAYLGTKHWKQIREEVAEANQYTCIRCSSIFRVGYHIHHNTYKRLGKEKISDLSFYCKKCHAVIHNNKKNKCAFNRAYSSIISSKMKDFSAEKILKVIDYIDRIK